MASFWVFRHFAIFLKKYKYFVWKKLPGLLVYIPVTYFLSYIECSGWKPENLLKVEQCESRFKSVSKSSLLALSKFSSSQLEHSVHECMFDMASNFSSNTESYSDTSPKIKSGLPKAKWLKKQAGKTMSKIYFQSLWIVFGFEPG